LNHLIHENSPYLLQHAGNPVDWYPYGDQALEKARKENKLLIISIGYAACHWCHVMKRECFEDEEVARVMNDNFVSIKVDREERPDIDHVYMNACFVMTGRGGWPLNVIALPDQRPVYGGTYFPRREWINILCALSDLYKKGDREILREAGQVMSRLKSQGNSGDPDNGLPDEPGFLKIMFHRLRPELDTVLGGTRGAPKFPMPAHLQFLLRLTKHFPEEDAREYLTTTFEHMAYGGIYDQLGGGFSRYSVDASWRIPHFEKMLYDNAQLVSLYSNACRADRKPLYRRVVRQTLAWISREMTSPEGLWYSSLDADSDGSEGNYYCWRKEEVTEVSGELSEKTAIYYGITTDGNFEDGKSVLHVPSFTEPDPETEGIRESLFQQRLKRIPPPLDDKVITSWNGMMIRGYLAAYRAFGDDCYLEAALLAGTFYRKKIIDHQGIVYRIWKNGRYTVPGFLDDYAFLITAFIDLFEATFDQEWIQTAGHLIGRVLEKFGQNDSPLFSYTSSESARLINTTIEITDQVIPSSNSEMARGLYRFGLITGNGQLAGQALKMLAAISGQLDQQPLVYGNWAQLMVDYLFKPMEIAIVGESYRKKLEEISRYDLSDSILYGGPDETGLETLKGKLVPGKTLLYLCRGKRCLAPVQSVPEAMVLLTQWH